MYTCTLLGVPLGLVMQQILTLEVQHQLDLANIACNAASASLMRRSVASSPSLALPAVGLH